VTAKPTVFKMAGHWVWQCRNHVGGPVGDEFLAAAWRNPRDVCMGAAVKHMALFHNDFEPVEVIEL
jgi:hypothetical protein